MSRGWASIHSSFVASLVPPVAVLDILLIPSPASFLARLSFHHPQRPRWASTLPIASPSWCIKRTASTVGSALFSQRFRCSYLSFPHCLSSYIHHKWGLLSLSSPRSTHYFSFVVLQQGAAARTVGKVLVVAVRVQGAPESPLLKGST